MKVLLSLVLSLIPLLSVAESNQIVRDEQKLIKSAFRGMYFCFQMTDEQGQIIHSGERGSVCKKQMPVCGTVKLPAAAAALKYRKLKNIKTKMTWNGDKARKPYLEKDMSLEDMFRTQADWPVDVLQKKLGRSKWNKTMRAFGFPESDKANFPFKTSDKKMPYRLTPTNMMDIVHKTYATKFPLKNKIRKKLNPLISFSHTDDWKLYGVPATCGDGKTAGYGWFTGKLEYKGENYYIVTAVSGTKRAQGPSAFLATKGLLYQLGFKPGL
ncbi:MAG: penicillin-binding transpeptidase domain-containing protein [bacterium]